MKILGAKPMLLSSGPNLVLEYWTTQKECLLLLEEQPSLKILSLIRVDDLSVWTGDNSGQLILFDYVKNKYKRKQSKGDMCWTDINVVGDAGPNETLWFVFEESEWPILDKLLNYDLTGYLKSIWAPCEEDAAEKHDNQWALDFLETGHHLNQTVINANISIDLLALTKGEANESSSDR